MTYAGPISVVDLFAGPGGLGEGFSRFELDDGRRPFSIRLSIEKDRTAHQTLELRALFRRIARLGVPDVYYDHLRGEVTREELFRVRSLQEAVSEAGREARCATLGENSKRIDSWISEAIGSTDRWILVGGPPCQAYSLAGRSRRRHEDRSVFESDRRHVLYEEYLRIIRQFHPPIFVMENVKGILSSTLGGQRIFDRILADLSDPGSGVRYEILSFTEPTTAPESPGEYVIKAENYGIPQARHRVILLGVREDFSSRGHERLRVAVNRATVNEVFQGMPRIRSRLSREADSHRAWFKVLTGTPSLLSGWPFLLADVVRDRMESALKEASDCTATGSPFAPSTVSGGRSSPLLKWLWDESLGGYCAHQSRSHIRADIQRYFFLSAFGDVFNFSLKLGEFPTALLPAHGNVRSSETPFEDRFRVQLNQSPSTTVVSHIAKDGHYYVHPDPSQARSITVREAARLQTFPDNYHFCGTQTEQFVQVGNAVPPYLAVQLAQVVHSFFREGSGRSNVLLRPASQRATARAVEDALLGSSAHSQTTPTRHPFE